MAVRPVRLQMEGISKRFGATVALQDVDLSVSAGEIHALVGENGAGKSTLVKVLSGACLPDSGQIWLDGFPFQPSSPLEGRRAGIGMIYQELSLAPHLSIEENILLGVEPRRGPLLDRKAMRERTAGAVSRLGLGHLEPSRLVGSLSPAEQQLVELARSIAVGCRVLVLDEPTSSLGQQDIGRLFGLIRELKNRDYAIVYISHFLEEVTELSDRFTVLRDGRAVARGETRSVNAGELARLMVGRAVDELYPRTARTAGEAVLEIRSLRGRELPRSASLTLHRGEVLGIAGLIGAGRTELLRSVFGLDPVVRGDIRVGLFAGPASPTARWAQGVGLLSEDRKQEGLATGLAISQNLTLTRLDGLGPFRLVLPSREDQAAAEWIRELGIKCLGPRQLVSALSGGNQQKVALARLLYHDVDVLLLDEPTRGIDIGSKAEIYRLIDRLASGEVDSSAPRKGILMVSSYLPELLGVCDRVAVMCRGVLQPARPASQLTEHEVMVEATGTAGSE